MNDESHEIRTENELKKNEMERILETMRSEIIAILALSPHAGYAWKGTTTDLLEVINAVVMSCELFDENGRRSPMTFACGSTVMSPTIRGRISPKPDSAKTCIAHHSCGVMKQPCTILHAHYSTILSRNNCFRRVKSP